MEVERRRAGVPLAKTNQPWKPKTRNSRRRHWTKVVRHHQRKDLHLDGKFWILGKGRRRLG
jgi:N-glycosylase/DNA lyase